ncbi:unnamed protein product [Arctogadus glacialis]
MLDGQLRGLEVRDLGLTSEGNEEPDWSLNRVTSRGRDHKEEFMSYFCDGAVSSRLCRNLLQTFRRWSSGSQCADHLQDLDPPRSHEDHLQDLDPPRSHEDHLQDLDPPRSHEDHLQDLDPPRSHEDHLQDLDPPRSHEDHLQDLDPPPPVP